MKNFSFYLFFILLSGLGYEVFGQDKKSSVNTSKSPSMAALEDAFSEGMRLYLKSDYNEAVMVWEGMVQNVKDNPAIYFYLAKAHLELKNMASALQNAKEANRLSPHSLDYGLLYADLLSLNKKYEEVIPCLVQLLQYDDKQSEVNIRLSQAYLYQEKYTEALQALSHINHSQLEEFPGVYRMKQLIYLKQHSFDKMIEEGENLLVDFPDETLFSWEMLDLIDFAKWNNAEERLIQLANKYPEMGQIALFLSKYYVENKNLDLALRSASNSLKDSQMEPQMVGAMTMNIFSLIKSKDDLKKAQILIDQILIVFTNDAKFLSLKADVLISEGKLAEAQDFFIKSIHAGSTQFEIWQRIIQIDFELNRMDSVIVHAEEALTLFPNQGFLYFQLGFAQHILGKNFQAVASLESAMPYVTVKDDWFAQLYSILGDTYHALNRYKESDASFDKVLSIDPNEEHVLNNYSYYLSIRKTNLEKASSMAKKLVEQFPENGTYLDTYAWVLFQKNEFALALPFLEKAIKGDKKENSVVWEHFGDTLYQLNRVEEAVNAWKMAKNFPGASLILDKKIQMKRFSEN